MILISCMVATTGAIPVLLLLTLSSSPAVPSKSCCCPVAGKADCSRIPILANFGYTGAGKTTLLDILAGRRRGLGVQGQLTLNGHVVDGRRTRDTVGYAMLCYAAPCYAAPCYAALRSALLGYHRL